jgi:MerR family transcriptional regulator, light-induced transcriptional regulator
MAAAHYPIRAVSRLTGLSVDTLRAWERRYGAVVPVRGDRGRVYSEADVARLKQLSVLVREGHAIGQIASLPDSALRELRGVAESTTLPAAIVDMGPVRDAIKRYDLAGLEGMLNRHAIVLPHDTLIFSVMLPILKDLGERWESGEIRPAQEHLVSAAIRSVLGSLLRTLPNSPRARTLVFATAAGERHELGLLCAAVLAATRGINVVYLGPDLPASDIAHAATIAEAHALLIAATLADFDPKDLRALSRVPKRVEIWAGGAQAAALRAAIGSRARQIDTLEQFRALCENHES